MQKIAQQLELAYHLKQTPEIKRVAEWAGRFKAIVQKGKSQNISSNILGNDPELLLPTELAMLNNPATKLDFYRRFTVNILYSFLRRGRARLEKAYNFMP